MQCPACGYEMSSLDKVCPRCQGRGAAGVVPTGFAQPNVPPGPPPTPGYHPQPQPQGPQADQTGGLIPYNNPQALTSYYVGLSALIPCIGNITGPAAIYLGIQGLKYFKEHPVVKGSAHAWVGIICGTLFGGLWWLLTLLVLIAMASGR